MLLNDGCESLGSVTEKIVRGNCKLLCKTMHYSSVCFFKR